MARKPAQPAGPTLDTQSRTARPTSVGPHHPHADQEDPANPGIRPEEGYAQEIATVNEAAHRGAAGSKAMVNIPVKGSATRKS